MIEPKELVSIARDTWGSDKLIKTITLTIASMAITVFICASAIPNEPIQIKENENE